MMSSHVLSPPLQACQWKQVYLKTLVDVLRQGALHAFYILRELSGSQSTCMFANHRRLHCFRLHRVLLRSFSYQNKTSF